jgi:hypothetical protein
MSLPSLGLKGKPSKNQHEAGSKKSAWLILQLEDGYETFI